MHELLAKSDRQLGMCLRMLYDERLRKRFETMVR